MAQLQCNVTINDSSAFNNVASHIGGAVYATKECLVYIERCQFNGCKVDSLGKYNASGGVLRIARLSKLIMKDYEIYNNTAQFGGGVAYQITPVHILITLSLVSIWQ